MFKMKSNRQTNMQGGGELGTASQGGGELGTASNASYTWLFRPWDHQSDARVEVNSAQNMSSLFLCLFLCSVG